MKAIKRILLIIIILILLGVAAFGGFSLYMNSQMSRIESVAAIDPARVKDGTYIGNDGAGPISVKVEVTVKDGVITEIKLLEHKNGIGEAASGIVNTIREKNSTEVDCVASATMSSKTIKSAVNKALEQGMKK